LKVLYHCAENVVQSSVGASRLSVSSDCSLLIRNITDEDADRYTCRLGDNYKNDTYVFLNILSSEYSYLNNSVLYLHKCQLSDLIQKSSNPEETLTCELIESFRLEKGQTADKACLV
uniref:Immunoglobulin V-set domain-containing protein n=1 Tax=Oryzias latipes TaxID=8090 RepID=A0A3P9MFE5_ORYLA